MTVLLDAGALISLERGDRALNVLLKSERLAGRPGLTHGGVVGQVWRGGGPRQALLARSLILLDIRPLDDRLGRRAGELLSRSGTSDVVGAALAVLTRDGDELLTSDIDDLRALLDAAGRNVDLIRV